MGTLSSQIQALITYSNEITGANDTRLGDAIKTLSDGYSNSGSSSIIVLPEGNLSAKLNSLLAYANEITGLNDTRIGDAIRTLGNGYNKAPEQATVCFYPSALNSSLCVLFSQTITNPDVPIGKGVNSNTIGSSESAGLKLASKGSDISKMVYSFDCSSIPSNATIVSVQCKFQARCAASRGTNYYGYLSINDTCCSNETNYVYSSGSANVKIFEITGFSTISRSDLDNINLVITGINTTTQSQNIYLYGAELTVIYE